MTSNNQYVEEFRQRLMMRQAWDHALGLIARQPLERRIDLYTILAEQLLIESGQLFRFCQNFDRFPLPRYPAHLSAVPEYIKDIWCFASKGLPTRVSDRIQACRMMHETLKVMSANTRRQVFAATKATKLQP